MSSGELLARVGAALVVVGLALFAWVRWPQSDDRSTNSGSALGDFLTWFDFF